MAERDFFDKLGDKDPLTECVIAQTDKIFSLQLAVSVARRVPRKISAGLAYICASFLLVSMPILLNFLFLPLGLGARGPGLNWLLYYVFLNFSLLYFPALSWADFIRTAPSVWMLLVQDNQRKDLITFVERSAKMRLQVLWSLLGGVSGCLALSLCSSMLPGLDIRPTAYLSVLLTSSLGLNAVYHLIRMSFFGIRVAGYSPLNLYWFDAAATPGFRQLADMYAKATLRVAVGIVLFLIPILYYWKAAENTGYLVTLVAAVIFPTTVMLFFCLPHYFLYRALVRERNAPLLLLQHELEGYASGQALQGLSGQELVSIDTKMRIYEFIKKSSAYPINPSQVIRYVPAVTGPSITVLGKLLLGS